MQSSADTEENRAVELRPAVRPVAPCRGHPAATLIPSHRRGASASALTPPTEAASAPNKTSRRCSNVRLPSWCARASSVLAQRPAIIFARQPTCVGSRVHRQTFCTGHAPPRSYVEPEVAVTANATAAIGSTSPLSRALRRLPIGNEGSSRVQGRAAVVGPRSKSPTARSARN